MRQRRRPAAHRIIIVVDVVGFGTLHRTNKHQVAVRDGLYRALEQAFDRAGIPWAECIAEDRGDGVFITAPGHLPKAPFVDALPGALAQALYTHNATHRFAEQMRLRMALNAGEVEFDDHGATSASVNLTFRLLDAPPLRKALAESRDVLALIVSPWFFDDVVRHSAEIDAATFRPAHFSVKETTTTGWISLPGHPYPPDPKVLTAEPARDWTRSSHGVALLVAIAFVVAGMGSSLFTNNELPSPGIPNVFCLADGETAAWQNHHSRLRLAASVSRLDENVFVADLPQSSPSVTFTARLGSGSRPDDCALQLTTQNALCLTVPADTGHDVTQTECTGSAAQQWLVENHWHHEGVMWERLRPAQNPDLCLAISGNDAVVHKCSTEWDQQWQRS